MAEASVRLELEGQRARLEQTVRQVRMLLYDPRTPARDRYHAQRLLEGYREAIAAHDRLKAHGDAVTGA